MDVTIGRDATRTKHHGPDPGAVRRRWGLETRGEFTGVPMLEVSTDRPLDDTVHAVVRAVWDFL
jgi:hypothetical protein